MGAARVPACGRGHRQHPAGRLGHAVAGWHSGRCVQAGGLGHHGLYVAGPARAGHRSAGTRGRRGRGAAPPLLHAAGLRLAQGPGAAALAPLALLPQEPSPCHPAAAAAVCTGRPMPRGRAPWHGAVPAGRAHPQQRLRPLRRGAGTLGVAAAATPTRTAGGARSRRAPGGRTAAVGRAVAQPGLPAAGPHPAARPLRLRVLAAVGPRLYARGSRAPTAASTLSQQPGRHRPEAWPAVAAGGG